MSLVFCTVRQSEVIKVEQTVRQNVFFCLFGVGIAGEKFFHFNIKVIAPWPRDHNTELWGLTVTEPLGKPLHLRHLAKYSPLAISALQEVTAFLSPLLPTTHDFELIYTEERKKNTTEETGNTPLCHREGKFAFLFI